MTAAPVVFVNSTGNVSGAEAVLLALLGRALAGGHRVTVVAPSGPLLQRLPAAVRHVELPSLGLSDGTGSGHRAVAGARLAARWVRAARILRPVVHEPGARTIVNSLLALPAVSLARPPGGASWLVHDTVHQGRQARLVRASRSVLRRAVAVSEATAAPLRRVGMPVVVATNGVRWPVEAAPLTPHAPPVVGCLALLTPWKGHAVLLDAVAGLPGVQLELAGGVFPTDTAYAAALHRRAEEQDLAGRVRFLGHVDALQVIRRWDVAVSASTSPEACPLSVLEAMSLGVPVVGTDHGGTSELLGDGAGLLVPSGDTVALRSALHSAITDSGFRVSSSTVARRSIATRHDIAQTLPAMLMALLAG